MAYVSKTPGSTRNTRIYIVELKVEMPDTPNVLAFGSKKAIFEYFGNEALHISYNYASTMDFTQGFENAVCSIMETRMLSINSKEIYERREREGREPIPSRGAAGALKLKALQADKKAQES